MYYSLGHMGYFGWFGMLLFWGAVIWLIVWLINQSRGQGQEEKPPLQIAEERFARGELTKKQFDEIKKEL